MSRLQPLAELRALFRRHPAFRQVFLADAACQLGDGGLLVAFPMLILQETGDVSLTGLAFSGEILAFALLSPLAGQLADRLEQRRVMLLANAARLLVFAALLGALSLELGIGALLVLSLALGAAGSFFMPARAALVRRLLEGAELEQAIALEGTMAFLVRLVTPALMGALLAFQPATVGIQLAMAAYALAIALLLPSWVAARPGETASEEAHGAWQDGWRAIASSPRLGSLLALDSLLCLIGMAAFSSTVAYLAEVLELGAQANGWLLATTGLAGAIGTQLAGRLGKSWSVCVGLTAAIALTYLLVPYVAVLWLLLIVWSLRGLAIGALGVLINQTIAAEVPGQVMGRVQAAWSLAACVAAFAGSAATPWLLRSLGAAQSFTLYGVLLAILVAVLASRSAVRWAWRALATRRACRRAAGYSSTKERVAAASGSFMDGTAWGRSEVKEALGIRMS